MKTGLIATAAAVCLAGCATMGPKTPDQLILGRWDCAADTPEFKISGVFDYVADGTATSVATVSVDTDGMKVGVVGAMESTWSFQEDGKLEETITSFTINTATMNGMPMQAPMVAMIQPMVDDMVVGQGTVSTVMLTETTFDYVTEDGVGTHCTR